jgi:RecB family exonuclease
VAGGTPAAGSPGHAAPASSPAAPSTLSYSALADHDRCGYRYYLQRILRLPAEADDRLARGPGGGLDPRVRGSIVHLALERLDLAAPREDALPDDERLDRLAARFGASDLTDEEREDLRGLVATFLDHPLHARLAAAAHEGRLRREHGFAYPLGDLLLNGFVDVRAREPDGSALVVDYKTDRLDDDAADLEALVERDYGAQRRIYALAELRAGAPAVEVVHLFLERPGAPVSVTYAAGDMPAIEAELLERAAAVLAGRFPVSPAPHATLCQGCPGRGSLCSWPREATEREAA